MAIFDTRQAGNYSCKDWLGLQEPTSCHSARTKAKSSTWDRQTPWPLTQPGEQLCREGPGRSGYTGASSTPLQQWQLTAYGLINRSTARWLRDAITPPHAAVIRPQAQYCTQFGISQYKTAISKLEQVQQKAIKMLMGWNTCPVRRSWGRWASSACRRDGFEGGGPNSSPPLPTGMLSRKQNQAI